MTVHEKNTYDKLNHALIQLDIIMALFVWLFHIAPYSVYYTNWDGNVRAFVRYSSWISTIVFVVLIGVTIFCIIKKGKIKKPDSSAAFAVILFAVHILIRINMLGSYQISDAMEYFRKLEAVAYYPQGIIFDSFKCGYLCGHIAHGFIFMIMLGQLLNVDSGMGFQYSNMVMGAVAAVCIYYIFKRLFPKAKSYVCAAAAFIVSVQPMFLGLSTSAQMEYVLAVLFIYVLCSYVTKNYILMIFWILLLGTCKETGTMMAFSVLGFSVLYAVVSYIIQNGGIKAACRKMPKWQSVMFIVFISLCVLLFIKVLYMPVWGGTRIIDVLKIGGDGRMNFQFEKSHFLMKARQLYILNFSWLWVVILVVGMLINLAVPAIRKRNAVDGRILSFIIIQYVLYTGFLMFFLEAKGTRYNILSDVLLLLLTAAVIVKVIDGTRLFVPAAIVVGGLAFVETFLTIDPVTRAVFTRIDTGGVPMVWTAAAKSELECMDINMSDFGYYNYQYTYADRAVDKMLDAVDYQGWFRIVSSFEVGVEDQFGYTGLVWDSKLRQRTYRTTDEEGRYHTIQRLSYDEEVYSSAHDDRCIFVELPYCRNNPEKAIELLSEFYDFDGPYTITVGLAGSISYYIMYLK